MKMKNIFFTFLFLNLFCFTMVKVSFSKNYQDNLAIMNCLKSADHPMNKTGGPEWDNIDENIALKICNQAFKKNPNSIKIIRSLARIYFKKKEFQKAYDLLIISIKKNDTYSSWLLGVMYENGEGVDKDLNKAFGYFKLAANHGYDDAQNAVGFAYENGDGVKKDLKKAFQYYKLSADQGYDVAQNNLGDAYSNGEGIEKDYKRAFGYYKLSADQGYDIAQSNLGLAYYKGVGVVKDYKEAFEYFKLAADQGYDVAQNNLGLTYSNGEGVEKDYKKSFHYFKLAADQGNYEAQNNLGSAYYSGKGIEKDYKKAFDYFKLAADHGHYIAQSNIGGAYYYGEGVKKNYKKAFDYYQLAADQGYYVAQNNLGLAYSNGEGVEKNYKKAFYYFKLSADQGYGDAQNNIGDAYYYGEGVKKNYKKAFDYYKLAADQGYVYAQNNIGNSYDYGEGVEKNYKKAFYYYKLAADQGNARALAYIGDMYENDEGFKKNSKLYFEYHEKAGEKGNLISFNLIGWKFNNGIDVPRNFKKAHDYYIKAGEESYALDNLGTLYSKGEGVKPDFKKAVEYYRKSIKADINNPYPLYNLGLMYFKEHGIERNIKKAIELFSLSSEKGYQKATLELSDIYELGIGVKKNPLMAANLLKQAKEFLDEDEGYNLKAIKKYKISSIEKRIQKDVKTGKFIAVLIANQNYKYLKKLRTPEKDVDELNKILKSQYGFETYVIKNAKRSELISKISKLNNQISSQDHLLIYYAGHGLMDQNEGFWLPVDAKEEDESNWISNSFIIRQISKIKATNILVMADSCFSGALLTRGISLDNGSNNNTNAIDLYLKTKSRIAISSGGLEPVLDGGGGDHSIFARMFINALKTNLKPMTSYDLFNRINRKITDQALAYNVEQTPEIGTIERAGHVGGDFVFMPKLF